VLSLYNAIPAGVGSSGDIRVNHQEERKILIKGAGWAVSQGYGIQQDLEYTEEKGCMQGADPSYVSERAYERGKKQTGTLGSGNHFIEIQEVEHIYDEGRARIFGLFKGQIVVMIHSGSRGLGHQICEDYVRSLIRSVSKYNISLPDRQLVCAPIKSPEAMEYISAMKCAANYAWGNRQCLMHLTRLTFEKFFNIGWEKMGMYLVYDVAHNIAKFEKHIVDGKEKTLCIHRKGATRAFPPEHPDIPVNYRQAGQPVIIPGDMGRNSYILAGTAGAMENTFGTTCHGAGRRLSRAAAIKMAKGTSIAKELEQKGIYVFSSGRETLAEEMPLAYKDVNEVVEVVHSAGIAQRVAKTRPLGVVKG
jgi:tRNA-splicing ligase RtcB